MSIETGSHFARTPRDGVCTTSGELSCVPGSPVDRRSGCTDSGVASARIGAARNGDREAQAEIINALTPTLESYVQREMGRCLRRHHAPSDVMQRVFGRVLRSLSSLPEHATMADLRCRARRHARWVMADLARQSRRRRETSQDVRSHAAGSAPHGRTGAITARDDRIGLMRRVGSLDPKYAEVVRLRLRGWDFPRIAAALDLSEAAVRKRYVRACHALRRLLR